MDGDLFTHWWYRDESTGLIFCRRCGHIKATRPNTFWDYCAMFGYPKEILWRIWDKAKLPEIGGMKPPFMGTPIRPKQCMHWECMKKRGKIPFKYYTPVL